MALLWAPVPFCYKANTVSRYSNSKGEADSPTWNARSTHIALYLLTSSLGVNGVWLRQKMRMSVKNKKDPKVKLLPWQQHSRRQFVSYMRYITGAKFEQHHSNISRDNLDFVIYLCTETSCDVISFLTKTWTYLEWGKIFQKPKLIIGHFERPFKWA